ncbi:amino acid adenylation domain-containing protein [Streptomyces demainii]|uniref:Amino acid adenylation domain-containing protein/FkbM family methyltransferase n=1 Tax=Streptomyces demainii TaxID=588122 RepID=A0ABT9L6Y7_9ACTN|nr:non-ribosomal peptide synthetase [Streptomyces demainii]MDP9616470.1 amino acid adenylation domain-containing protein/FkbM family methyltransferase [Streptomyces demainii]
MTAFDAYPLSPAQRAAWASTRTGPGSVLRARVGLAGALDHDRLRTALHHVAQRHEALRIRFVHRPELHLPLQTITQERFEPQLTSDDPGLPSPDDAEGVLHVRLTGTELIVTASALAVDTESLGMVLRELALAYDGTEIPDDLERLQFLDVVEWQREQEEQRPSGAAVQVPDAAPARLLLAPHTDGEAAGPSLRRATLPPTVAAELRKATDERGRAVEDLVAVAWLLALSRYADVQADDASALRIALYDGGRATPSVTDVVGPLAGHVPMMLPLPLSAALTALCDTVGRALDAARLASLTTPPLGESDEVAAGLVVVHEPGQDALAPLGAVSVTVEPPRRFGTLDLVCTVGPEDLSLTVRSDAAGCPDAVAERLLQSVVTVLTDLPAALLMDGPLDCAGPSEARLLMRLSGAAANVGRTVPEETLTELLDAGVRGAAGDRDAVVAADGRLTFAELDATADAIAARLADLGTAAQDRVAVLGDRSWRTVAAFLGVLRAGAVYVPVDPAQPRARVRELLELVDVACVLGGGAAGAALGELAGAYRTVAVEKAAAPTRPAAGSRPRPQPDDAAYIIFTSGSTGTPRPAVVEQRSAAHLYRALNDTVYQEPRPLKVAVNAPFVFDASVKQLVQLASGSTLYLVPQTAREDGAELAEYLARHRVDVFDCTPSHLGLLLEALEDTAHALPPVLLIGGEAIDPDLWQRLRAQDGVRCFNLYGPTECTVDVTVQEIVARQRPAIGRPLPGLAAWVLDDRLRLVPPGVPGELCVSGPQLARGYFGDTPATERRFVETVLFAGQDRVRLYRTGDRVRYAEDGGIEYLGRLDDQAKLNGYRVEPGEAASVLQSHPGVRQATAVVVRDESGTAHLVAYAVAGQPAALPHPDAVEGINPHETRYLYDEIFVQQVYLRHGVVLKDDSVVFDVGANIGMFTLFAHTVCPNARVYAFEPLSLAYEKLQRNTAEQLGPVRLFPYGLSDAEDSVPFTFYPGYSMMSGQREYADPDAEIGVIKRFLSNARDHGGTHNALLLEEADELLEDRFQAVEQFGRVRRLSDVIDEEGVDRIDLLKIDVQRAELSVLGGLEERHWAIVSQVAMEVHDQDGTETEGRLAEITALLERHGFRVVTEQDGLLDGTDRYALYAVRPEYAADPRPVRTPPAVSGSPADAPDAEQLRSWLAERLPTYAVPTDVILLDALPLTTNGKIDKAALPAPARARATAHTEPENATERLLLEIWRDVLDAADFGVEDRFFDLGGDSIRGIRMRAAAARRGLTFPLRYIFRYQTIRELVREGNVRLEGGTADAPVGLDDAPATAARPTDAAAFRLLDERDRAALPACLDDAYPLSALQLGMVYHAELSPDRTAYHVVTVHRVERQLDPDALRAALAATVASHPALRTSFDLGRFAEPLQLVHRTVEVPFGLVDLTGLDADGRRRHLATVVDEERSRPFTWSEAPLVRFRAVDSGDGGFDLVCAHHHAIMDGWSLHLFLDELLRRYGGAPDTEASAGGTSGQKALPYRRFVELERQVRESREAERFWARALRTAAPLLLAACPEDAPGTSLRVDAMRHEPLPAELGGKLATLARERGLPVKSLLLAVHLRALAEEAGRDDVVTGLVVSGRPAEEGGDRTIGLFLNTLPVAVSVGDRSLAELGSWAWQFERDMMGHHLLPLADVQSSLDRGPLFDVFFNFTQFHSLGDPAGHTTQDHGVASDVAHGVVVDFEAAPEGDDVRLSLQYDGARLTAARAERLGERYRQLLETLAVSPDESLSPVVKMAPDFGKDHIEEPVSAAWRELIGLLPRTQDENFFEAGGDSLLALRLVAMLRDRHGIELDLGSVCRDARYSAIVRMNRKH